MGVFIFQETSLSAATETAATATTMTADMIRFILSSFLRPHFTMCHGSGKRILAGFAAQIPAEEGHDREPAAATSIPQLFHRRRLFPVASDSTTRDLFPPPSLAN